MITIIATRGAKQVLIQIPRHLMMHREGLEEALHEIGFDVVWEVRRLIKSPPKTGRMYGTHQASAPGEAPANRTGKLAGSSDYKVRNWQEMAVGETAEYAKYLEDGTRRMEPRPHLITAVNLRSRDTIRSILENVDRELRR